MWWMVILYAVVAIMCILGSLILPHKADYLSLRVSLLIIGGCFAVASSINFYAELL